MHWVVQNNLFNELAYKDFVGTLKRLDLSHQIVKVVPFTDILLPGDFDSMTQEVADADPVIVPDGPPVIAMGTTTLCRIAGLRGWSPGTYMNDNFNWEIWRNTYGLDNVLNPGALIGPVKMFQDHPMIRDDEFVRPVDDSKCFPGTVMTGDELREWATNITEVNSTEFLNGDTRIIACPTKVIHAEYRLFVVDGKIVTASQYKLGTELCPNVGIEEDVDKFAREMIANWEPCDAYVLDIARTPLGLKVIEINNINSCGFYACDVFNIIKALEELEKF